MLTESDAMAAARERLSALADGELESQGVVQACALWRDDAESRVTWHAYQLIGDVLRSDDLARHPAADVDFLAALRLRLADEPIVFAPQQPAPVQAPAAMTEPVRVVAGARRRSWMAPAAVAAGFVAVAGVLTITRLPIAQAPDRSVASALSAPALPAAVTPVSTPLNAAAPAPEEPQALVATGQVIRDARLDRYLAAHKQFAGSSALGVPSVYLRNASAESTGR